MTWRTQIEQVPKGAAEVHEMTDPSRWTVRLA